MVNNRNMFLGCDPYSVIGPAHKQWKEWQMQAYCVQEARRMGYCVAADMNAGQRNGARAKAEGMQAGETDLRFYLPMGQMKLIELKRKGGSVSKVQKDLHSRLAIFGHSVTVIFADCPGAMWDQVRACLPEID